MFGRNDLEPQPRRDGPDGFSEGLDGPYHYSRDVEVLGVVLEMLARRPIVAEIAEAG